MNMIRSSLITCLLALFVGCGGGGGTTPPDDNNPPPVGGIGRTGIAQGPISTFGSIVVNGVHYDTSSAMFTINDAPGSQDDLRVGQVVTVSGSIDDNGVDGDADEVEFEDNVTGPIESIDPVTGQIVVLGQTVLISPETSFDDSISPASIDGLAIDDIIEVSGLVDANGRITATRIESKTGATELEVKGIVSNLNTTDLLFDINSLTVDYSAATLENFSGGTISNGDLVEAKGTSFGAGGELIATRVEREDGLAGVADGVHIEIQGFITRFQSAQDFDVTGLPVTTTTSTIYEGGVEGDLGLNVKVEVEGDVNASGVLVATKVEIRRAKAVRVTANVDSVNATANSLVLLGITVNVDLLTRLEDKSDADVRPLTLTNINAGDYVEIRGTEFPAGSGTILAAILERDDANPDTILQGFVESIEQPAFTILGVTIQTNGSTVFRDENNNAISAGEFF
ncbi:MAG: DUF5666 domain-containing protein, partial [Gammaproteobacteria bacterium]|nr:DUF5666 domain-containing protein [Gammaproteobacteria bacterium]